MISVIAFQGVSWEAVGGGQQLRAVVWNQIRAKLESGPGNYQLYNVGQVLHLAKHQFPSLSRRAHNAMLL